MLSDTKIQLLQDFAKSSTLEELIFAKGFLEGYLFREKGVGLQNVIPHLPPLVEEKKQILKPIIIYGTETGNAKKSATQLLSDLKKQRIQAKSVDIQQYNVSKLKNESLVYIIISTQGDGELPQSAQSFYNELKAADVQLENLQYAVFALGDSSYPLFCNAGILIDELFAQKGAKRLLPLVKADIDYKDLLVNWQKDLDQLQNTLANEITLKQVNVLSEKSNTSIKKNYIGQITHKIVLNDRGSNKTTYHIEITSDDDIQYQPGDALGIIPKNASAEVLELLAFLGVEEAQIFTINNVTKSAFDWLTTLNIKGLTKRSIDKIGELFAVEWQFRKADLIDLLKSLNPIDQSKFEDLLGLLSPVIPRLYSISSSKEAHEGQVHLTVNLNTFHVNGILKKGLASRFLAEYPEQTDFEFYIHPNNHFRLPDDDKDIILIGPGTGIAPFRSFLAERDARGAKGKNWLFFGEQHFVYDFYYQTEIQEWLSTGLLTKLSTAFSRDQHQKIYVQDRIKENAALFNQWIEEGASIYVCGQKDPMSKDVAQTIIEVFALERHISIESATAFLEELETSGRYLKDVY